MLIITLYVDVFVSPRLQTTTRYFPPISAIDYPLLEAHDVAGCLCRLVQWDLGAICLLKFEV